MRNYRVTDARSELIYKIEFIISCKDFGFFLEGFLKIMFAHGEIFEFS